MNFKYDNILCKVYKYLYIYKFKYNYIDEGYNKYNK